MARSAARGDAAALEELLAVLRPRIIRSVRLMVGSGRPEAEDVAQDALADIYRHIGTLRSPESVVTWAFRIASRRAIRAVRKERFVRLLFNAAEDLGGTELQPDPGIDAIVLKQAFDHLPARMRAVAVLRLYAGLSEDATAAALGCSVGTVKSQLHEARKRLATSISDHHERRSEDQP